MGKEIEESVQKFVTLNGEYRVEAFTVIKGETVDLRKVIEKFEIKKHDRIPALNGQFGIKALMDIAENTCLGQYFGGEILQKAFGKVFDGTGEEHDHNIYAFDQKIDPLEIKKLKQKQKRLEIERESKRKHNGVNGIRKALPISHNNLWSMDEDTNNMNKGRRKRNESWLNEEGDVQNKVFIIDPFIGDWKENELLLRYVNDCRADIDDSEPTIEDQRCYNVEFVGMKVNGWPQTYLIAKRDIKKGDELMTFYGTDFSNAITMKLHEEQKKQIRKARIDAYIPQNVKLFPTK